MPLDERGDVDVARLEELLEREPVKVLGATHVSNVSGAVVPVADLAERAHAAGALFVVDAAQSIRHEPVDVQAIGCDFLAFSGRQHARPRASGFSGAGAACWKRSSRWSSAAKWWTWSPPKTPASKTRPCASEAGTPNYVGAIALAAALDYLCGIGRDNICCREHEEPAGLRRGADGPGSRQLSVVGRPGRRRDASPSPCRTSTPSTWLPSWTPRAWRCSSWATSAPSRFCTKRSGVRNVTRLSTAFYNTFEEIDACVAALERVVPLLQGTARSGR